MRRWYFDYRYRWYYLFLLTFVLWSIDFLYDIKPCLATVQLANKQQQVLNQQIKSMQNALAMTQPVSDEAPVTSMFMLSDLLLNIQQQHIKVKVVNLLNTNHTVHIVLQDEWRRIFQFLIQLNNLPELTITYFSIQPSVANQVIVTIDVNIYRKLTPLYALNDDMLANIFCFPLTQQEVIQLFQSVTIKQIAMRGYLQQGAKQAAYLTVGNADRLVAMGDVIGKEQGVVQRITKNNVLVLLPDHTQHIIPLNSSFN